MSDRCVLGGRLAIGGVHYLSCMNNVYMRMTRRQRVSQLLVAIHRMSQNIRGSLHSDSVIQFLLSLQGIRTACGWLTSDLLKHSHQLHPKAFGQDYRQRQSERQHGKKVKSSLPKAGYAITYGDLAPGAVLKRGLLHRHVQLTMRGEVGNGGGVLRGGFVLTYGLTTRLLAIVLK
jgi:hypothetical protein